MDVKEARIRKDEEKKENKGTKRHHVQQQISSVEKRGCCIMYRGPGFTCWLAANQGVKMNSPDMFVEKVKKSGAAEFEFA